MPQRTDRQAAEPVQRVLEDARHGPVVFRRHDHERVGGSDGRGHLGRRGGDADVLDILIVEGQGTQRAQHVDGDVVGREFVERARDRPRVGRPPEAPGQCDEMKAGIGHRSCSR